MPHSAEAAGLTMARERPRRWLQQNNQLTRGKLANLVQVSVRKLVLFITIKHNAATSTEQREHRRVRSNRRSHTNAAKRNGQQQRTN